MTGQIDDLGLPPFFHAPERGIHRCVSQRQAPVNVKSWQATGHPLRRMSVVLDAVVGFWQKSESHGKNPPMSLGHG